MIRQLEFASAPATRSPRGRFWGITPAIVRALTVRAPRVDDGVMAHTKSHRKLASEMRETQLKKEQCEAPLCARLKMETMLAVAEWVNGG